MIWVAWALLLALAFTLVLPPPAHALDALEVREGVPALDLSHAVERVRGRDGRLAVSTAPDAEGIVRRIEVRARPAMAGAADAAPSSEWAVFALANTSDEQVDRLLVAPRHRLVNSGWWRPDLGAARIRAITPSEGFALERRASDEADMFLITLDPGTTITFAAELTGAGLPELTLWAPDAWRDRADAFTLFHGIVLGVAGLLAAILSVMFVVRGQAMFPAGAALAWGVLFYAALDFGFVAHVAALAPAEERLWRAWLELLIAAGFVLFPFAYLALPRWHRAFWWVLVWPVALGALAVVATFDPALAAGGARVSLALSAALGSVLVAWLALRGFDRAVLLVPGWALVVAWTLAAWAIVSGAIAPGTLDASGPVAVAGVVSDRVLGGGLAQPALIGGLVLLVLLLAFTVMQQAFAGAGGTGANPSDVERRALALAGSGDAVFDWEVGSDRVHVDASVPQTLGLSPDELGSRQLWLAHLDPRDRDRFVNALDALVERAGGRVDLDLRLRGPHGRSWFALRARPVLDDEGAVARCIGTLADVTRERTGRDQLLRDAVHDNLTGLPLREILLDRLRTAIALAENASGDAEPARPTLLIADLDRFAHVNESFGLQAGDGVLLAVARRIGRIAAPADCAARLGGDRFALLVLSRHDPDAVVGVAERVRAAISSPIAHAGPQAGSRAGSQTGSQANPQIALTASIGVATWSADTDAAALLADAELAVEAAKREGGDRIMPFRPAMRAFGERDYHLENDLRHAIARGEMLMLFQPVVRLNGPEPALAGFEALMRWRSPARGLVGPADFIPLAERSGLIEELGAFAIARAAEALAGWRVARGDLFASVNVSSRQLMRHELIEEVDDAVQRHALPPGALKLEITESLVMENPERAALVLERARDAGASLALDDFGTGYSSLSHLTRLPFDTLKIDRSLVRAPDGGGERPAVLRAVVQMGRDLGLDVVAEGAETQEDADALRALGVPMAQGFLFGEAVDAKAALAMVKRDAKRARKAANDADGKPFEDAEEPVAAE